MDSGNIDCRIFYFEKKYANIFKKSPSRMDLLVIPFSKFRPTVVLSPCSVL